MLLDITGAKNINAWIKIDFFLCSLPLQFHEIA